MGLCWILATVIDTGQKISDMISIFPILVEAVEFQWISPKKLHLVGWVKKVDIIIAAKPHLILV